MAEISLGKMKKIFIIEMIDVKVMPWLRLVRRPYNAVNCPYWLVEFDDTHT